MKEAMRKDLTVYVHPCNDSYMNTNTDTAAFGTTSRGEDFDGHNGYSRGIFELNGTYTALGAAFSRDFKTLRGAIAFMARMGYDAHGRRLDR